VSGVDCVLEDTDKPTPGKPRSTPTNDHQKPIERSHSENDVGRASVDSTHSSSSSSGQSVKEQTEVYAPTKNEVVSQKDEKERGKEAIKKQMAQRRRKSASERSISKEQSPQVVSKGVEHKHCSIVEEKTPARRVRSAGSDRPPTNEVMPLTHYILIHIYTKLAGGSWT